MAILPEEIICVSSLPASLLCCSPKLTLLPSGVVIEPNMGWNVFEGFEPFSNRYRREPANYTPPVFAYKRKFGNSITGGYVFRGDKQSPFYGFYICGDYTSKRIWALKPDNRTLIVVKQIATSPQGIASFATDEQGDIFVVGYEGMIYKLDFKQSTLP